MPDTGTAPPDAASHPGLRIRPARPEEARSLTALALASKAVWGYAAALRAQFLDELTITPAYIRSNSVLVAEDGGRDPLAVGALDPVTDALVDLDFMFVAPAAMRRGIGRALFERLVAEARARGFPRMKIVADPHAVGFYERMGAARAGEEESASVRGRMLPLLFLDL
jgi:GNAT superfamily N-acetyltransferase